MTDDIIKGIATKLHQTFGAEYRIYTENIEQGFKEPCFSIELLLTSNEQDRLASHYIRRHSFNVHYFPKDRCKAVNEIHMVARQLFLTLEYILVLDNLCKGSKMSYEIQDNQLHFFVDFTTFVTIPQSNDADYMGTLTLNTKLED